MIYLVKVEFVAEMLRWKCQVKQVLFIMFKARETLLIQLKGTSHIKLISSLLKNTSETFSFDSCVNASK